MSLDNTPEVTIADLRKGLAKSIQGRIDKFSKQMETLAKDEVANSEGDSSIGELRLLNSDFSVQSPLEAEDLEKGWKRRLVALGLAGAFGIGALAGSKFKGPEADEARMEQVVSRYTQDKKGVAPPSEKCETCKSETCKCEKMEKAVSNPASCDICNSHTCRCDQNVAWRTRSLEGRKADLAEELALYEKWRVPNDPAHPDHPQFLKRVGLAEEGIAQSELKLGILKLQMAAKSKIMEARARVAKGREMERIRQGAQTEQGAQTGIDMTKKNELYAAWMEELHRSDTLLEKGLRWPAAIAAAAALAGGSVGAETGYSSEENKVVPTATHTVTVKGREHGVPGLRHSHPEQEVRVDKIRPATPEEEQTNRRISAANLGVAGATLGAALGVGAGGLLAGSRAMRRKNWKEELDKSDSFLEKSAPPGFDEETMHRLKEKYGTESAFKIAWAAYKKKHHGKAKKMEKGRADKEAEYKAAYRKYGRSTCPNCKGTEIYVDSTDSTRSECGNCGHSWDLKYPGSSKPAPKSTESTESAEKMEKGWKNNLATIAAVGGLVAGASTLGANVGRQIGRTVAPAPEAHFEPTGRMVTETRGGRLHHEYLVPETKATGKPTPEDIANAKNRGGDVGEAAGAVLGGTAGTTAALASEPFVLGGAAGVLSAIRRRARRTKTTKSEMFVDPKKEGSPPTSTDQAKKGGPRNKNVGYENDSPAEPTKPVKGNVDEGSGGKIEKGKNLKKWLGGIGGHSFEEVEQWIKEAKAKEAKDKEDKGKEDKGKEDKGKDLNKWLGGFGGRSFEEVEQRVKEQKAKEAKDREAKKDKKDKKGKDLNKTSLEEIRQKARELATQTMLEARASRKPTGPFAGQETIKPAETHNVRDEDIVNDTAKNLDSGSAGWGGPAASPLSQSEMAKVALQGGPPKPPGATPPGATPPGAKPKPPGAKPPLAGPAAPQAPKMGTTPSTPSLRVPGGSPKLKIR